MERGFSQLQESRQIWRLVGIFFICLFMALFIGAIAAGTRPEVSLVEVMEISKFNFPENVFAIGIRFRDLESNQEAQKAFLVESEENQIVRKGGRYALVYERCGDEKLKNIGIKYKLLKVYELK